MQVNQQKIRQFRYASNQTIINNLMKAIKPVFLFIVAHFITQNASAQELPVTISSPDNKIVVEISINEQQPYYSVTHLGKTLLEPSKLGIATNDEDFTKG